MDTQFAFPRSQTAIPRPQKQEPDFQSRQSHASLRASVLETALELGIGSSSTVTKWMFDNSLTEEDEEEVQTSPSLTSGSTATSDSSHTSVDVIYSTPRSPLPTTNYANVVAPPFFAGSFMAPIKTIESSTPNIDAAIISSTSSTNTITMQPAPEPEPVHEQPATFSFGRNRLKKRRGDSHEDDGYVSDSARKRKEKEKKKKEGSQEAALEKARKEQEKEEKKRFKAELKASERMRKKSATAKDAPNLDHLHQTGYETDNSAPRKEKSKKAPTAGDGYETDDGYLSSSSKKKKGFFKRSKKNGHYHDLPSSSHSHEPVPPMPLPVAGRFATTFKDLTPVPSLNGGSSSLDYFTPPMMPAASQAPRLDTPDSNPSSFFDDDDTSNSPSISSHPIRNFLGMHRSSEDSHPEQGGHSNISFPTGLGRSTNTKDVSPLITLQTDETTPPFESSPRGSPPAMGIAIGSPSDQAELTVPSPNSGSSTNPGRISPRPRPFFASRDGGTNGIHSARHSQLTIVPSVDFIVPSPQGSPGFPSSPIRHLNDQPPPTPPPSSPLPLIPSILNTTGAPLSRRPSNENLDAQGEPLQRGRTSPFPTKPLITQSISPSSSLNGLSGRANVARYRDLYALPNVQRNPSAQGITPEIVPVQQQWENPSEQRYVGIDIEAPSDDEADVDELRDALLGRFKQPSEEEDADPYVTETALDRSQSRTLRDRTATKRFPTVTGTNARDSDAPSLHVRFADALRSTVRETQYTDDIIGMYSRGDTDRATRESRWTESVYSRQSFVDDEASGEFRQRLATHVEDNYDEAGREIGIQKPNPRSRRPIEKF